jgi:hypothetical protein
LARRPTRTQRRRVNELLEPFGQQYQDAFLAAIDDITSRADVRAVIAALELGNYDAAVAALHIDQSVFAPLDLKFREAYQAGGAFEAATLPSVPGQAGTALVLRFDAGAAGAAAWVSQYSGTMIKAITDDQLNMSREHMRTSLMAGRSPRDTALDLVGRIDPRTRARSGGLIGLTDYQAQLVRNAYEQLAGGSPAQLRAFLARELRDKRFDSRILNAIKNGKPLPKDAIERMITSYTNNMLRNRAETIARTEMMTALHTAQHEARLQMVAQSNVKPNQVRRIWDTSQDKFVRDSHGHMEGQSVGLNEPFISGDGNRLMYPGDPNAPASDRIKCRCDTHVRIDYLANLP